MKIAVFGGDKRMLFSARAFADEGHTVYVAGYDDLISLCEIRICGIEEAAKNCDIAILPVRPVADECLNAPFSDRKTQIDLLLHMIGEKPVFCGCADLVRPYACADVYDYTDDEDFMMRNARLTAEGAVGLLIADYEGSVSDTEILVTGYGRIGKALSSYLQIMGADVTVAARKPVDRKLAEIYGLRAVDYSSIDFSRCRVIINTVPSLVIDSHAVDAMRNDVFIIDLASKPGGVDHIRAKKRDLSCIHALSLPGKTAPLAAGKIIKDTIMNIMNREGIPA